MLCRGCVISRDGVLNAGGSHLRMQVQNLATHDMAGFSYGMTVRLETAGRSRPAVCAFSGLGREEV